jgi:hypothetical protein
MEEDGLEGTDGGGRVEGDFGGRQVERDGRMRWGWMRTG